MRKFLGFFIVTIFLFGTGGISNAVEIENIAFSGCVSEICTPQISVTANDPLGGNLDYAWEILNDDDGLIIGSGANVLFDPPDIGPHPHTYQVKVTVTSDASDLAPSRIIDIYVKLSGDVNCDGVVNILDKVMVRNHFGQSCGDPGWEPNADVNCDCVVNILDKVYVRNQFGKKEEFIDEHYFYDNFECGANKWVLSGLDWNLTESAFQGGNWSLTDSPGEDYSPNADAIVRIQSSVDLSTSESPVLTFWHKYMVHNDDYLYVDVSTDNGLSWNTIWNIGDQQWSDTWRFNTIDLSAYKSSTVKIRFRLRASDSYVADGWTIDDVAIKEKEAVPVISYPFLDDFESGLNNWLVSGVEWNLVESGARGGNYAITESSDGNYSPNAGSYVVMNGVIDLFGATSPVLNFWHKYMLHNDDHIYVDISVDFGLSWTNQWTTGDQRWVDTWTPATIDLSNYIDTTIMIRFRLIAYDSYVHDGWHIDDIAVQEGCADGPVLPFPFCDEFESGLGNWQVSGLDWALTETDARSLTHSVTDSPEDNYSPNAYAIIMTKGCVDLSSATFPILTFWSKYWLQNDDYVYVDISTDCGVSWTNLWSTGDQKVVDTWNEGGPFDLRPYIGSCVKIRFRLRASDSYISDGWYLDDVCIHELD